MPSLSDHTRRDAEHAARSAIRVAVARFTRRMDEQAKAAIKTAIESAAREGRELDGTKLGREVADQAIRDYVSPDEPVPAIEAAAVESPAGDA